MRRALVLAALTLAGCGETPRPAAQSAPTPAGTLFLAGREPGTLIRVDVAAGTATTHHVKWLSGGDPPHMVAFTGGRIVLFSLGRATSLAPDLSDPRSLGESWYFVPSATPGRVWNILLERHRYAFRGVRETTVDGRTTFARHARVPGWAVGAVPAGLLLQRNRLEVWDPRRARIVRRLPGPFLVAAHGSLVASCSDRCARVHLTDTATGAHATARFAGAYRGAFSPDGTQLAVRDEGGRVAVIDVTTRAVRVIARTGAIDYPLVAWASNGWLYYTAAGGTLAAWRPGAPARALRPRVGTVVDMAAD